MPGPGREARPEAALAGLGRGLGGHCCKELETYVVPVLGEVGVDDDPGHHHAALLPAVDRPGVRGKPQGIVGLF